MNRKHFKRKLNKYIKNDILTVISLDELKDKKSLFNNASKEELLGEYALEIINNCSPEYIVDVINYLCKFDTSKKIVEDNFISILSKLDSIQLQILITESTINIIELINNSFDSILNSNNITNIIELFVFHDKYKLTEENYNKLNEKIEMDSIKFISIMSKNTFNMDNINSNELDSLYCVIDKLVSELLLKNHLRYVDIKLLGTGSYSKAYGIGNMVLKLGDKRGTYNIPNDKRILQPLIRVNLKDISNIEGTIEVSNKVDSINLSNEEMYSLYKELRDRGIVFTDIKNDNFGLLIEDNNINYDGLDENSLNRGFDKNNSDVLKKGDVVIIDTDYIYKEGDPSIHNATIRSIDYEKRYQLEHNNETESDIKTR